jgi:hypothetical protein
MEITNTTNPPAAANAEGETSPAPAADLRTFLITTLGLTPAEGQDAVTDEQIREALTTAIQAGQDAAAAAETVTTLQSQLTELQAKYDTAVAEIEAAKAGEAEKEIDALLAPYADLLTDDTARAAIRDLLATNRPAGEALLKNMQPASPATTDPTDQPPAPMHDPAKDQDAGAPDESTIATAISSLAKKYQAENAALSFADAWSRAEKEINGRISRGESIS